MRRALEIARKEWLVAAGTPATYVVGAIFLVLCGFFFFDDFFLLGRAEVRSLADPIVLLLLATTLPALTMQALAEERRSGTLELLLTHPVRPWEVVAGKAAAPFGVALVVLALTLPYALTAGHFGNLDTGAAVGVYLGLVLVALLFVSLGVLTSSQAQSPVVAFAVGWFLCFALFAVGWAAHWMPPSLSVLADALGVGPHLESFARGAPDSRDVIWFLSLSAAALALATRSIAPLRGERAREAVFVAAVVGSVVLVNLIAVRLPVRMDLTEERLHTVSAVSKQVLRDLPEPLVVDGYITADLPPPFRAFPRDLRDLLAQMERAARGNLRWTVRDPGADPLVADDAARLGIPGVPFDRHVGDRVESRTHYVGLRIALGDREEIIPLVVRPQDLEYEIVALAVRMARESLPQVALLTGHYQRTPPRGLAKAAEALAKHYEVLWLPPEEAIPPNTAALLVVGPAVPLGAPTMQAIDAYLQGGGGVAFFADPVEVDLASFRATDRLLGVEDALRTYGVVVSHDLLQNGPCEKVSLPMEVAGVRTLQRMPYHFLMHITDLDTTSPVTRGFGQVIPVFASTVTPTVSDPGVEVHTLLQTSEQSWQVRAPYRIHPIDDHVHGDVTGPHPLGVSLEGDLPSPYGADQPERSRLLVIGDAALLSDDYLNTTSTKLLLNTVDWLIGETDLGTVRTRGMVDRTMGEPEKTATARARLGNTLGPPLVLALLGGLYALWAWRRRKRMRLQ
ncbi:MAG: Gldg family protein [Deltaproteobacteria bacterium]|nr:Gldg family protein [Deltaproteobacteria bacterium]MBW2256101.1 Gldg family protein [Deltaproteobacteria bacterium]